MKITNGSFLRRMLLSRPVELPGIFARRLREMVSQCPSGIATTYFGDVRHDVDLSLHAMSRKYYFHTHEMFLENVFRQFLKPGSTFVDIGANMGYWSAFSASLITTSGEIHAFEPAPRMFAVLSALARNNPSYRIFANNVALGAEPGVLPMAIVEPTAENYNNFEINVGSNSILPGFLTDYSTLTETIDVEVTTFNDYMAKTPLNLDKIGLVKVDVEGFEPYCFAGMSKLLSKSGTKVPILCEILTDSARRLDGAALVRQIESYGYRCLDAITMKPIDINGLQTEENVICV